MEQAQREIRSKIMISENAVVIIRPAGAEDADGITLTFEEREGDSIRVFCTCRTNDYYSVFTDHYFAPDFALSLFHSGREMTPIPGAGSASILAMNSNRWPSTSWK